VTASCDGKDGERTMSEACSRPMVNELLDHVTNDVARMYAVRRGQAKQAASGHREGEHPWFVANP